MVIFSVIHISSNMAPKNHYEDLSDTEKIKKQWHKMAGLNTREEWSAAIVRAATAAEIAANFAIRNEFKNNSTFASGFVDSQLRWANGIDGKFNRLLIPLTEHNVGNNKIIKGLKKKAESINKKRNAIVHQGEFCNPNDAMSVINTAKDLITTLIKIYDPDFNLEQNTNLSSEMKF